MSRPKRRSSNQNNCLSIEDGVYEHTLQKQIIKYSQFSKIKAISLETGFWFAGKDALAKHRYLNSLKQRGVLPGTPDMVMLIPGGGVVWVELKVGKNKPTQSQDFFREFVKSLGHRYEVVHSLNEWVALEEEVKNGPK